MRKTALLTAVSIMILFSGCGSVIDSESSVTSSQDSNVSAADKENTACAMEVYTTYSGWGGDGNVPGSGSFDYSFEINKGDVFLEDGAGHWYKCKKSILGKIKKEHEYDEVIAEIKEITADGVTVKLHDGEKTVNYGNKLDVDSIFVLCGGTNYQHSITFTDNEKD